MIRNWYKFSSGGVSVIGLAIVVLIIVLAIFAPVIAPYPQDVGAVVNFEESSLAPSMEHIMGTDTMGRDVFSRLLISLRSSLLMGILVLSIAVPVGFVVGVLAGYYKDTWIETVLMRIVDIFLSVPALVLALAIAAILEPNLRNSMIAITIMWWPWYARLSFGVASSLRPKVQFNSDDFVTEQVFFPSKDGVKIPMFLTYKKDLKKDGKNPVFLYGYGGFGISLNPGFSSNRIPFLENGGIYAQVNLRGGSEYGEEWHVAGTKMQKQNVFDDFISAAEYLISQKYTDKDKIAIVGGSNGGLLVGACMTQRPDLFRVAIPQVGVMDMLRYHKFTIGWNWASDYGTSEDSKEMFEYLRGYSPLHNLKPGTKYPATLVTTADHDDRVVPAHSFKFAATLQADNDGTNPTLIRIDSKAGHGAGKPMAKVLEEQADIYGFIMYNLGMKPKF